MESIGRLKTVPKIPDTDIKLTLIFPLNLITLNLEGQQSIS